MASPFPPQHTNTNPFTFSSQYTDFCFSHFLFLCLFSLYFSFSLFLSLSTSFSIFLYHNFFVTLLHVSIVPFSRRPIRAVPLMSPIGIIAFSFSVCVRVSVCVLFLNPQPNFYTLEHYHPLTQTHRIEYAPQCCGSIVFSSEEKYAALQPLLAHGVSRGKQPARYETTKLPSTSLR